MEKKLKDHVIHLNLFQWLIKNEKKVIIKLSLININKDMSIVIIVEDNRSVSNTIFPEGSVIGKNCEFTNCEFKKDCMFNENCKFTNCEFDTNCKCARGCAFKLCNFILVSNFRI